jgi:23S rRNA pseudouridine2605 synthase
MAAERLQKYLARAGVASRRHAEELITAGRVTVNNETVTELGSRVEPGKDLVAVDGTLVTPPDESSYYLLYKPIGVVTTLSDPQGRPTVGNYVEETGKRLFPVGRLDYDAEGALLFTDDGALAHKLTHPSFQVPRMYLAKVKGVPDAATLDKLRGGVRLEDGMATPLSVDVFEAAERNTWLKIVVAEGRPHLIKRLCAAVGHPVVRLFRPAYAGIGVEGMRPGELRSLKKSEVEQLNAVSEGRAQPAAVELKLPPRRHGRAAPGFEGDEEELSMDDDAPAPRKPAARESTGKRAARAMDARPEKRERKPVSEGGSGLPKFGRTRGGDADAPRGAGRPARKEWGAGGDEGGAARPARKAWGGEEGGAPRSRGAGRPERSAGGEDRPRARGFGVGGAGRPERREYAAGAGASRAPRGEGRPVRKAWSGGDEGGTGRPARKTWGAGGDEGGAPRGAGRPVRKEWGAGGAGARAPRGEGRPERKEWSAGGAEGGAARPARKTWGAGAEGGAARPARKAWGGDEGGAARPARKAWGGGDEGGAPRGAGRPARKEWNAGGDEGAPRSRGGEDRPRARGFGVGGAGRTERREYTAGAGASRAPRGEGRPVRKAWGGGDAGGAPRGAGRPERREWTAGGAGARGAGRPERGEGRPPRREFGGDAEGRAPRGAGRPFSPRGGAAGGPRGAGRPERREFSPRGAEGGAPRGRSGPGRPAFGRGEGARGAGGRPERREWSPTDDRGNPNERVVRAGARRGPPGERGGAEKSGGFKDWDKKKERGTTPRWSSGGPRGGGAGRPPPRGPRRPR